MPTIVEWRDAYAPRGLRVVTMHLPREEADTGVAVADAFDNRYVSYFLFARQFGDEG